MTKHPHKHSDEHKHQHAPQKRGLHKDWRAWVVVGLMLAAMAAYVLSMNESIWPGRTTEQPEVPAAP